ncbi:hypothetical protein SARC_04246 [Sphaeroforma arctica JP610]|uniref:Ricin B lectin domain-containing protein n=1 Tax=Sphaeroforma arctica JP610 TaxID=667725 RepID=A0A0L0G362_9EUKA|nr:hypothetical protein SARC_04246 [Sphaeroforma arctica JP610]KNC83515.1 hypothetical protein SARC_04246 [Sphaeroforma arctica JP610]|eukprot:XP_014157417.1 hypothetical protein SARC_04246 [Sphaeroforma arctica JP610]
MIVPSSIMQSIVTIMAAVGCIQSFCHAQPTRQQRNTAVHYYSYRNIYHPQCMTRGTGEESNVVMVGECDEENTLYLRYNSDTKEVLTSTGECLLSPKADDVEGYKNIQLGECNGTKLQTWELHKPGDSEHHLRNRDNGLCADVKHQHWDTYIVLWKCKKSNSYKHSNQGWQAFGQLMSNGAVDYMPQERDGYVRTVERVA